MKTLIAYASKTGTTAKCAQLLAAQLENTDIYNLENGSPDISDYNLIVIGGSIRAGMLHKSAKKYIKNNCETLKSKKVAFFICCTDTKRANDFFKANIPKELLEQAVCTDSFGGEMDINKQKGLFKLIAKKSLEASAKKGIPPAHILKERINIFAKKLKEYD